MTDMITDERKGSMVTLINKEEKKRGRKNKTKIIKKKDQIWKAQNIVKQEIKWKPA